MKNLCCTWEGSTRKEIEVDEVVSPLVGKVMSLI